MGQNIFIERLKHRKTKLSSLNLKVSTSYINAQIYKIILKKCTLRSVILKCNNMNDGVIWLKRVGVGQLWRWGHENLKRNCRSSWNLCQRGIEHRNFPCDFYREEGWIWQSWPGNVKLMNVLISFSNLTLPKLPSDY